MDLNVDSVLDDMTSGGREFHVRDAATARSPMVQQHVKGTTMADVDEDCLLSPGSACNCGSKTPVMSCPGELGVSYH